MNILSMNKSFRKMFSCSDALIAKNISYLIDPAPFEKLVSQESEQINEIINYNSYNLSCHLICYKLPEENQYVGVFVDITDVQYNKKRIAKMKTETILQAQELIEHQVDMAQKIAQFLGENSAKGEVLMQKLINTIDK